MEKVMESHGILEFHFPGLENHGISKAQKNTNPVQF